MNGIIKNFMHCSSILYAYIEPMFIGAYNAITQVGQTFINQTFSLKDWIFSMPPSPPQQDNSLKENDEYFIVFFADFNKKHSKY